MGTQQCGREIVIGGRRAPNRLAVLPTEANDAAPSGGPSPTTVARYVRLAEGGAGIVFSEAVAVGAEGKVRTNQLCISPANLGELTALVDAFRSAAGGSLFLFQLDHGGSLANPDFARPVRVYAKEGSDIPVASDAQIDAILDQFIAAAVLAQKAGADGIEIKASHGFFCNELLRPANTRKGRYGGDFDSRAGGLTDLLARMRKSVGQSFLLGIRISAYEGTPGGFGTRKPGDVIEDMLEPIVFAKAAQAASANIISVSGGDAGGNLEILTPTARFPEGVYRHFTWAHAIKTAVSIPVVGAGYSNLADGNNGIPGPSAQSCLAYWAEKNLAEGNVDIVGIGRQAIADPLFPRKLLEGRLSEVDWCERCSGCGMLLGAQQNVGCVKHNERYKAAFAKLGK